MSSLSLLLLPLLVAPTPEPSPRELMRNHFGGSELTIVIGLKDPSLAPRVRGAMERQRLLRSGNVRVLEASEIRQEDLANGSIALIGSAKRNPWLEELLDRLPLRREALAGEDDFVQMVYPNPLHPAKPVLLFAGGSDAVTLAGLEERRNAELHVRRKGKTVFLGFFDADWSLDPERSRAFEAPSAAAFTTSHLAFFLHGVDESDGRDFASRLERLRGESDDRERSLDVHLYPSLEYKGLVTGNTRPAHFEGQALHASVGAELRAELVLTPDGDALSKGRSYLLAYDDETLDYFDGLASRLLRHDPEIALEDPSNFAREALTASLARYEEGHRSLERQELESAWRRSLASSAVRRSPTPELPSTVLRGVNYTQEGFGIHDGYLSASSDASLDKLVELGANAVSIVPYAFMRDPHRPDTLVVPDGAGAETDESVIHAIRASRRRGLTVLLKPQIWIRRSWPGEIRFESASDTAAFFDAYRRWIRHYALMADRYGVEGLVIGTELAALSGSDYAHWEELIREIRAAYRGKLVYAANWGDEVENVVFWPLLDYIGVDFYYPLSREENVTDAELVRGFEQALASVRAIGERHGMPILLTEVGYASAPSPWIEPHASDRRDSVALEAQARAYEAAFRAMADEGAWIKGAFWWKWPTTLAVGGAEDRSFTPNGKPAEDVLRRWFEVLARR